MRLIDANKLLERMKKGMESGSNLNGTFDLYIEHAPTIDAVEVVRCKDCETIDENGWCEFINGYVHDGFCAWGKQRR